ncbi:hypothetical protein [Planococcus sp. CAU13]|uniref:hypothetical protein n=1 Tax=Planococcus sp. CAU13 TaxID=1541197 RepID=UPI000690F28B|nr:hypothetical protein [Planococcus sp. CAU13]
MTLRSTLTINQSEMDSREKKMDRQSIKELLIEPITKDGKPYKKYPTGWKLDKDKASKRHSNILSGGIYFFWWQPEDKDNDPLMNKLGERGFNFKGRKIKGPLLDEKSAHEKIEVKLTEKWIESYNGLIPLYVGKSSESMFTRISQHLQITHPEFKVKNTSNQLRRGIKELFDGEKNIVELMVNNIHFSYIPLHGPENSVDRFYMENYFIGKLRPVLNLDVER